jgi:hypothetical protein
MRHVLSVMMQMHAPSATQLANRAQTKPATPVSLTNAQAAIVAQSWLTSSSTAMVTVSPWRTTSAPPTTRTLNATRDVTTALELVSTSVFIAATTTS